MTGRKQFGTLKKNGLLYLAAGILALLLMPAHVQAAGENDIHVLAYAEQEGMGAVTSYCNDTVFEDSVVAKPGDVILVSAEYYPKCTFEGWYLNGILKSTQKSCSFTVTADTPMYVVTARFRQNGEQFHNRAELDISRTNWANRTCRFAEGSGIKNVAVTTSMAVQGAACMAAFDSVLDDYTLARTYNITFTKYDNSTPETLQQPADLVFRIPADLQAQGRVFRMIHVYKGQPVVLMDADSSDSTITFRSDKAGAYALVYLDVPSSMPADEIDPLMSVTPEDEEIYHINLPDEVIVETVISQQPSADITAHNYTPS